MEAPSTTPRTYQQVSQRQLLCAAFPFIPAVDLKSENLSLAAIILKHLKQEDGYFRGLILLNLHMLLLQRRQNHFKKKSGEHPLSGPQKALRTILISNF